MATPSLQGDSHTRRVRLVVILTRYASIGFGVPWMVFFALSGHTMIAVADGVVVLAGMMAVRMARRNQLRTASILLVGSLYLRLVGMAVFFDVPSAQVPRSIHHFFIPLAVAIYLMLKHDNAWLRRGMAWACLATVVLFSNSDYAIVTSVAVPDSIRATGTWLNNLCAMLLLYLLLYIFVAELDKLEARLHSIRRAWVRLVHSLLPAALDRPLAQFGNSMAPTIPVMEQSIADVGTQVWHFTQASRVLVMVHASSTLMVAMGLLFGVYFAATGAWQQAGFQSSLVLLGVSMTVAAEQQRGADGTAGGTAGGTVGGARYANWHGWATVVWVVCLMLLLFAVSVVVDLPSPGFARSNHYWFVPLALAAYFLLRHEGPWIQNGLPIVCLLAFIGLASTPWGIQSRYSLPPEVRPPPWLVCSLALAALYFYVYILVGDIKKLQDTLQTLLQRRLPHFLRRKRVG